MASGLESPQALLNFQWTDRYATFMPSFYEYFKSQKFTDVTLICQGRSIGCHQLVLSASSTYFKKAFEEQGSDDSVFYLDDVVPTSKVLEQVLEFMYKGSIRIKEDELRGFIQAGKKLEAKGIVKENAKASVPAPNEPSASAQDENHAAPAAAKEPLQGYKNQNMTTAIENVLVGVPVTVAADAFGVPKCTLYENLKALGVPMSVPKKTKGSKAATGNASDATLNEAAASGKPPQIGSDDDDDVVFIAEIQRSNIGGNSAL